MTMTLTAKPSNAMTMTKKPRIKKAGFGDGYSQRVGDGLNTRVQMWNLTFEFSDAADRDALEDFFDTLGGTDYFFWTPPNKSIALRFICEQWGKGFGDDGVFTLNASLEQVFDA